jgi:hypothetical protein
LAPRPAASELWNNVPKPTQQQIVTNAMRAATQKNVQNSSLAKNMQHVFEPVTQHYQHKMRGIGNQLFK